MIGWEEWEVWEEWDYPLTVPLLPFSPMASYPFIHPSTHPSIPVLYSGFHIVFRYLAMPEDSRGPTMIFQPDSSSRAPLITEI